MSVGVYRRPPALPQRRRWVPSRPTSADAITVTVEHVLTVTETFTIPTVYADGAVAGGAGVYLFAPPLVTVRHVLTLTEGFAFIPAVLPVDVLLSVVPATDVDLSVSEATTVTLSVFPA